MSVIILDTGNIGEDLKFRDRAVVRIKAKLKQGWWTSLLYPAGENWYSRAVWNERPLSAVIKEFEVTQFEILAVEVEGSKKPNCACSSNSECDNE